MPGEIPAPHRLLVIGVKPEWSAVIVNCKAPRNALVSVAGRAPVGLKIGDVIPEGTMIRLAFNIKDIRGVETASALQTFCLKDYFRVKASVVIMCGGAGTGKSFTRNKIIEELTERRNLNTVCLAPTGLVAQSMPAGRWCGRKYSSHTVRWFELHPPTAPGVVKHLHVIVDEYTMVSSRSLDRIWEIARRLCRTPRLTLIGDHAQLWPVEGLPPWSSKRLQEAQDVGDMAVYRLSRQQRYGDCEQMQLLIDSLRNRRVTTADAVLYKLAIKPPPALGTCRLVAATNALAAPANERVHETLSTHEGSAVTVFMTSDTNPEWNLELCNGERVRVCSNRTEATPGGGVTYTQVNGQEGIVCDLPGGSVAVTKDTRITIKLLNATGAELKVGPCQRRKALSDEDMFDDEAETDPSEPPKKKRRRKQFWTFQGALRPSSGQTAHTVQGSTLQKDEKCVVDLAGFPQSILGFHMLIVALSRVQSAANLYVLNYDHDMVRTLAKTCPCGCVTTGPHLKTHSKARLESFEKHMEALKLHLRALY